MARPVSVCLIAQNEEARLARTLAAVAWVDQIVVVDSGSTDRTREIAGGAGAEVHRHAREGHRPQKSFAESLGRHDWLLNLDADEVVTPGLADEIRTVLRVAILTVYPGRDRPRWLADDCDEARLYHRAVAPYRPHPLFDRVESDVAPGRLRLRADLRLRPDAGDRQDARSGRDGRACPGAGENGRDAANVRC